MEAACAALTTATCILLMTSQFALPTGDHQEIISSKFAQQDHQIVTAAASSDSKAGACSSSTDKAFNLCMIRGFFNITSVQCDCTESKIRGAPAWECVGTVTCKK
jgi:hypothetical protein